MNKIRVLHLTWNSDNAGMMYEIIKGQFSDPDIELDVCFGTLGKGIYYNKLFGIGIVPHVLNMKSKYSLYENFIGGVRLTNLLSLKKYDVIHLQEAILLFPFLAATNGYPQLKVVLHNRGEFHLPDSKGKLLGQFIKKIVYKFFVGRRVNVLICNSEYALSRTPLMQSCKYKLRKIFNAVDTVSVEKVLHKKSQTRHLMRSELHIDDKTFMICSVARLVGVKRLHLLIMALKLLVQEVEDVICVLAGDGPMRNSLEELVNKENLSEHVIFLGHRTDALKILASADAFVLPSVGEAFGNAALEAVCLEVPTIVFSDSGGPLEFISDGVNGHVVNSVEQLSGALLGLCKGKGQALHGKSIINKFGINSYLCSIKQIYIDLLSEK